MKRIEKSVFLIVIESILIRSLNHFGLKVRWLNSLIVLAASLLKNATHSCMKQ
jgi:hypothetical protein